MDTRANVTHRAHSKTVGGLPLVSDTFLLQKQQTFNRSKNLERKLRREPSEADWMTLVVGAGANPLQEWCIHAVVGPSVILKPLRI